MKQLNMLTMLFVATMLCLWSRASILACTCEKAPLIGRFSHAKYVFSAKVKYRSAGCLENILNKNGTYSCREQFEYVVLAVTMVWKGQLPREVVIVEFNTDCGYPLTGDREYILFTSEYSESQKYQKAINTDKSVFLYHHCGGNDTRDKVWDTFLNRLVGLSNIMYELEEIIGRREFYSGLWNLSKGLPSASSIIDRTNIFDIYGNQLPHGKSLRHQGIEFWFDKKYISNGWYFLRCHSGTDVIILPFVYYEDRFYYTDKGLSWK
jgi:hypothetical protein